MKSTATSLVLGLVLFVGCGGGVDGPRGSDDDVAGSSPMAAAGAPVGVGGSSSTAGSGAGGAPPSNAGAAVGGTSAGGATGKPCGPAWMAGTTYAEGAIVLYQSGYYVAEHENPGYDPIVSTYFWEPYSCPTSGGGSAGSSAGGVTGTGGSAPLGDSAFDDLVTESLFNQMFPDRNGFYTYQGLVNATRHYPLFTGDGGTEQRKREAAAFLANVARETGHLVYIDQIAKDVYCSPSAKCPCEPGKLYYGRGPIQISWNYNYCMAGEALGIDLRGRPELVSQDATIAWETGLWFWMTQRGAGNATPHDSMVGNKGFGETIRSINGSVECNGGSPEGVSSRVDFYQHFCQVLGITPGDNQTC